MLCDDALLIEDSKENLQNILIKFDQSAKKLNMEISLKKTKCLSTSKANQKCEIKLGDTILEQVAKFNYLGVEISSNGNLREVVKTQVTKGARISGCLNNLIWRNRYMSAESKVRIYKTSVRPVLTYAAETRADTITTQQLLRTTEMRIIRTIQGKTLRGRVRSEHSRQISGIPDIVDWVGTRKREWPAHVDRMGEDRLAKVAKEGRSQGVRSRGRPKKDRKRA